MGSKEAVRSVLKHHTKTVAWMSSVSKVKGHNAMYTYDYIQCIPLPWKVKFQWAKKNDGNDIFHALMYSQCGVMGDDATVFPAILGYSSEDIIQC
eukprot:9139699-Ditylum_brightwellii.AAC.1